VSRAVWVALSLSIASIAWGALAFGAVYPWAYWSLMVAAQVAGILGIFSERRKQSGASRLLIVALLVMAASILVQLLPLSADLLSTLSPATLGVVRQLDLGFATGATGRHAISIQPSVTWTALALFGSFALLMVGTSRLLSLVGAETLTRSVTIVGVALALVGIIQKPLYTGKLYGFWTTQMGGNPFGPFVNKNHFAGWMLMGLPLALGLLCVGIARGMRGVKPVLRERILWFSSADANQLLLLALGIAVMALALVLTMSRSGISALALALATTGVFTISARIGSARKAAAIGYMVLLVSLVVFWVGADTIAARFGAANWDEFNGRRGPWSDAWRIASMFPLTGTGLNTYGTATLFFQQHDLAEHYAEAHNDYLQLAAEGGLLLVIPALLCVALFVRDVRRRFREDGASSAYWLRAGAVAALVAIALQETVEFSLQMPGNAALFAVVCGIALHKSPSRRSSGREALGRMSGLRV
jgi:O-antigen ligase